MKTFAVLVAALVVGLTFGAGGVLADEKPMKDRAAFNMGSTHMDSKQLIGMKVNTPDDKHVGEIDYLIVDTKDAKVSHVVVGLGGLVGVGEKHVVVPWSQVKMRHEGRDKDVAIIDRATLDNAPKYVRSDRDRTPAASPSTTPSRERDRDRDGVPDSKDRAPSNPNKY
jgi:sporulation protein YlmC with PRC-barrel domain